MVKALQFHRIVPDFQWCGTWNKPRQFESFLRFFRDHDLPITLPGTGKNGIIITFDDGEKNIFNCAFPLLKKYNFKALVFLIAGYVGKKNLWDLSLTGRRLEHLSWGEIREMKNWGIEFGSHGLTHRNLTKLSGAELDREIGGSKAILEKEIGPVESFSYPFNRVNSEVLDLTRKAGYKYGFGGDGSGDLMIKKEAIYITDTLATMKIKIFEKPKLAYGYERIKQKAINAFTIATMLVRKDVI
jgi:peptidoglycan/xylan/chitin deacetylase (PgdA/CDA1 family)